MSHTLTLKEIADFPIGVAIIIGDYKDNIKIEGIRNSEMLRELVFSNFNSITVENEMKMDALQPLENKWFWDDALFMSSVCKEKHVRLHGHTLAWHNAVPEWVNQYVNDPVKMKQIFENHIQTVATKFRGHVKSWDVINEVVADKTGHWRETIWYKAMGPECIKNAFRIAHDADPDALLFYNDYDLEYDDVKLQAVLKMIDQFQAEGIPIHGMGLQMHIDYNNPPIEKIEHACNEFVKRNLIIHFSELDIRLNALNQEIQNPVFTDELEIALASRYEDIAKLYQKCVPKAQQYGITVWGVSDKYSWLRTYFKRLDWPHLFDDYYRPKKAYFGFLNGLKNHKDIV